MSSTRSDATPPQAPAEQVEDVEMGQLKADEAYADQEPYIGTAITAGAKEHSPFRKDAGTIVKTVSMNQIYSDR